MPLRPTGSGPALVFHDGWRRDPSIVVRFLCWDVQTTARVEAWLGHVHQSLDSVVRRRAPDVIGTHACGAFRSTTPDEGTRSGDVPKHTKPPPDGH